MEPSKLTGLYMLTKEMLMLAFAIGKTILDNMPHPPPAPPPKPKPKPAVVAPKPKPKLKESIILLPQEDGNPSAVVVTGAGNRKVVLNQPYMTASVDTKNVVVGETTAEKVAEDYSELIAANPQLVPRESIILLPQEDGKPSAVVVTGEDNQQVVLDQPYMTAAVDASTISVSETTADKVKADFGEIIAANPPTPKQFVLFYEFGGIKLTAGSKLRLDQAREELKNYPAAEVVVTAHTDTVGSEKSNDKLSLRRAEFVKSQLMEIGIPENIIQVAGRGEHELLVPTKDRVAEPLNRRVELEVR
jgi:outer membrane protein OmpA-like peptidoglycan-associated protein